MLFIFVKYVLYQAREMAQLKSVTEEIEALRHVFCEIAKCDVTVIVQYSSVLHAHDYMVYCTTCKAIFSRFTVMDEILTGMPKIQALQKEI